MHHARRGSGIIPRELIGQLRAVRTPFLAGYDAGSWLFGFLLMAGLQQLTAGVPTDPVAHLAVGGLACALTYIAVGAALRLHQGRAVVGSFDEAFLVGVVAGAVGLATLAGDLAIGSFYRPATAVMGPIVALMFMICGRAVYRLLRERSETHGGDPANSRPVVMIGAGEASRQLLAAMRRDHQNQWRPVALVDDDPLKRHRRIGGIPVVGGTGEFPQVAARYGASTVIMAIPSAPRQLVRKVSSLAARADLCLKVLPGTAELLDPAQADIADVRDIDVTDLLGRHQIETDVAAIAGYLTARRVLVTGAGGSIGSELCRQPRSSPRLS